MHLSYSTGEQRLRAQLRTYFADLLGGEFTDLAREEHGPRYREWIRRLGTDGWLGIGWPEEFGGQGRTTVEQFIFFDEAQRAGAPVPMISLNTVGPTLMAYGTAEQKATYLPRILRGEIDFAIGYSEPSAGTDLASLRTRAVRDGDHYVVNGTKVFTSRGATADHVWLAVRTDPTSSDHRGITVLIVDTASDGYKATPIRTLAGYDTYATFYDDVLVPVGNRVGEEHGGWPLIATQLNHERIAMAGFGGLATQLYDDVVAWAAQADATGHAPIDLPWVQADLARCRVGLDAMVQLNRRMAWAVGRSEPEPAASSVVKVYGTEVVIEVYRLLMGIVGPGAVVAGHDDQRSPWADLDFAYRRATINTFGGGTNEVQREIVARAALGLPRVERRRSEVPR